jgi:YfiH family protein
MFHVRRIGELMILESDLFPVTLKHAFATHRLSQASPASQCASDEDSPNFRIDSINETAKWWVKLRDRLFTPEHVVCVHNQVHSGTVRALDPEDPGGEMIESGGFRIRVLGDGDGIIKPFCREPIYLGITTADCLPCLAWDPVTGATAAVHSGWRGLAADIHGNAVRTFKSKFGAQPADLHWAIGPSIDQNNYEVGMEVIAALETAGFAESDWESGESAPGWKRSRRRDHYMVSLSNLAALRLRALGVPSEQIDICALSTYDNPNLFFSYRRDGEVKGLQAAVIG